MPSVPPHRKPLVVEATALDEAGHGVGLHDGLTLHVTDLAPGERAEVQVEHQSPHRPEAWARIVRRSGPLSGERTTPPCPAWGRCGGCVWQHVSYPTQLVHKRARVVAALAAAQTTRSTAAPTTAAPATAAAFEAAVAPVVPSPAELGYRYKGKYVVGTIRGHIALGAWAPRRHHLVDTAGCRIVAPVIDEIRERVRVAAERAGLAPWDEQLKTGWLRYVIIRAAHERAEAAAGSVLVVLVVRRDAEEERVMKVARELAADGRVAGVLRVDNDRDDGGLLEGSGRVLVGETSVRDVIAGVEVELGAGEFAQVNPAQADAMYARVAELAEVHEGERVADVYAGVGGISFALARAGAQVVAIERDAGAIAALRAAAARAGLGDRIDARAGDAALLGELRDVSVVVVNPPRKGLSADVIDALVRGPADRIIYVSCGPEALGRDVALLAPAGFAPDVIEPFDLMPGTAQIETVARLRRSAR